METDLKRFLCIASRDYNKVAFFEILYEIENGFNDIPDHFDFILM